MYAEHMNPTLNKSSALQHFEHGNAIENHKRIMFAFYMGLPHTVDWEIFAVKIFRQLLRWQKLNAAKIKRAYISYAKKKLRGEN